MSAFEIYWLTRMGTFHELFRVFMVISIVITFISVISFFINYSTPLDDGDTEECRNFNNLLKKISKISGIVSVIFILLYGLIPSNKEVALIYVVPKITQSDIAKQIPEDLSEIYKSGIEEIKGLIKKEDSTKKD